MYRSVLALLFASVLLLAYFYVIDPTVQNGRATTAAASTRPAFTLPTKARERR